MSIFLRKYLPVFAPEGAAGAGAGDGAGADKGAGAGAGDKGAAPWYQGVDAETLGHWQNKGWKTDDPKEVALAATKQAREAEKFFGVPPDQIIRLPKADAKPEDWKAFHLRLGAPADPKEYDFSGIKFNGEALPDSFADAMRRGLAEAFVPKDRAAAIVKSVVAEREAADKAETAVTTAKVAEEKALLAKNWGKEYDFNHLKAMEGARRLGITPEAVQALENQIGYAAVMEAMRKIGAGTSEDMFVDRGAGGGNGVPTTREGAMARKSELMADMDWAGRYLKGGAAEKREMTSLNQLIDGLD